ncbi:MAG: ATP-dependent DNA helicase [Cytophagaceae bacterium]
MAANYTDVFEKEINRLNTKQKEAVQQIEGPVLVIAGPGTGKTQILSARIGAILTAPGTPAAPHNILCLTYTEAGAIAMRKRLLKFIGPDAHRVPIYTFHAFCNVVIQENIEWFGVRQLQPISDLESIQIFTKLIDSIPLDHPLKRLKGEVYYDIPRLRHLFDTMKKEGWTVDYVLEQIQFYKEEMKTDEKFIPKRKTKGSSEFLKTYYETLDKLEKLEHAAKLFPHYSKLMEENHYYDFNDMITWVNKAFKENENMLRRYQEKFLYLLVDEFQDTSGAQLDLLKSLAAYWEVPNLFAVGDDDQSIYRFQGANIKNIVDFNFNYQPKVIVLDSNYRSSMPILEASMALIQYNNDRLVNQLSGLSKQLEAKGENAAIKKIPVIVEYENPLQEEAGILQSILQLHESGVPYKDIAILYRNHKKVDRLVQVMQRRELPLSIKRKYDILKENLIQQLIEILSYLQKESQYPDSGEMHLFKLMHYPYFHIDTRDIAHIVRYSIDHDYKKWRLILADDAILNSLPLRTKSKIQQFEKNIMNWLTTLESSTIQVVLEKILTYGNVFSWIMKSEDKTWYMQVVSTFFDYLKDEMAKKPDMTLQDFLEVLEQLQENKISIPLDRSILAEEGVQFITAHSSKGLEFDYVFIMGGNAEEWEAKRETSFTFFYPPTLTEQSDTHKEEEERRLFYVAMTRAKKELYISYASHVKEDKESLPSRFITELLDSNKVELVSSKPEEAFLQEYLLDVHSQIELPELPLIDHEQINVILEKYKLSVTHLNKFLKCPLSFYFENLLQVPSARTPSNGFGLAIHGALRRLYNAMLKSNPVRFPEKEFFLEAFEQELKQVRSHFTPIQYDRYLHLGKGKLLSVYYDKYHTTWNINARVEYAIKEVEVDGIPIKGAIDKIEIDGRKIHVVDYKTGKINKAKVMPPNEKNELGGDYWRQLVFYKILIDNERYNDYHVETGEIDFVEGVEEANSRFNIPLTSKDVEIVRGQMKDSYQKIMNHEFTQGCGEEDCTWCNFVKYNFTNLDAIPETDESELS